MAAIEALCIIAGYVLYPRHITIKPAVGRLNFSP